MEVVAYTNIIERLFSELDTLLQHFVFNGYNALANALRIPLGLAATLHIVLTGIGITQGWMRFSLPDFVKLVFKIALIYTFALNWGIFSQYLVAILQQAAGELGDILIKATPISLPHFTGQGINGALQVVLVEMTKIGAWVWDKGAWNNPSPFFTAAIIWGFGYAMMLVA